MVYDKIQAVEFKKILEIRSYFVGKKQVGTLFQEHCGILVTTLQIQVALVLAKG